MSAAKRHLRERSILALALGTPVALTDGEVTEGGLRWVHVATTGTYAGYSGGAKPFEFSRKTFETILSNFHANPQYLAGVGGVGSQPVVPYDYEHASEKGLSLPSVAQHGAPASGWAYELEIRDVPGGASQLWALSEFVGDATEQVDGKQYRWTSVAVHPALINPVSGVNQGATLTSIALTNKPFLQGLAPIAASLDQFGKAETPLEVLVGLREIFQLPTEGDPDKDAILTQLQLLTDMWVSGAIPSFVDLEHVFGRIRSLLGMPLLVEPQNILETAVQAVGGVVSNEGGSEMTPPENPTGVASMAFSPQQTARLALAVHCSDTGEEAIVLAAEKAAKESAVSTDALAQLRALFGGDDAASVIANATKLSAEAAKLAPVLEQLTNLQGALKGVADGDAEAEAEKVAASMAAGNAKQQALLKPAILMLRKAAIKPDGTVDQAILATFRTQYAEHLGPVDAQRQLLTSSLVAGNGGAQLGGPATLLGQQPILAGFNAGSDPRAATIAAINAQPGFNELDKANAYLCSQSAAHKALPRQQQIHLAGDFVRQLTA